MMPIYSLSRVGLLAVATFFFFGGGSEHAANRVAAFAFAPPSGKTQSSKENTSLTSTIAFTETTTTKTIHSLSASMVLTEEEGEEEEAYRSAILNKAAEFVLKRDYDDHYHPLSDEEKQIEVSKFWLSELQRCQLDPANRTRFLYTVDEATATEAIVGELWSKIRQHEQRLENLRDAQSHSVVPLVAKTISVGAVATVAGILFSSLLE